MVERSHLQLRIWQCIVPARIDSVETNMEAGSRNAYFREVVSQHATDFEISEPGFEGARKRRTDIDEVRSPRFLVFPQWIEGSRQSSSGHITAFAHNSPSSTCLFEGRCSTENARHEYGQVGLWFRRIGNENDFLWNEKSIVALDKGDFFGGGQPTDG